MYYRQRSTGDLGNAKCPSQLLGWDERLGLYSRLYSNNWSSGHLTLKKLSKILKENQGVHCACMRLLHAHV